jgi:SRSO17 transposase
LVEYRQHVADLLVFHLRQQLYQPKTVLAADLVREAVGLNVPFSVVTFDSWFLHTDLIEPIEALHKDWVGGCPKDRLVWFNHRWVQLQAYLKTIPPSAYRPTPVHGHSYWAFTKVLALKSLQDRRIRIVASFDNPDLQGEPCLVGTNRLDWERTHILFTYSDRWPTETFNEDVKGHLGFEDYQLHKLRGIRRHWYLCLAAYSLLGDQGHPGRSRHGVPVPFESTGQRCQAVVHELLGHLVDWIAQRLEEGVPAATITQTLLA